MTVSVVLPVRNGGETLPAVLGAVRSQEIDDDVEIIVCDSGSTDGSRAVAQRYGATVLEIEPGRYSHGGTRNDLVESATGAHVALLTQDAVPASRRWLRELMRGFVVAPDAALVFGPYRARNDAGVRVRRELEAWFRSLAPDGQPRVDRLGLMERDLRPVDLIGPRAFFTDANGCVARNAWKHVPFRRIPYAEDQQLALDMLYAGYAKVYMPAAEVVHSHEYGLWNELRRAFDEWRALREVFGYVEPLDVNAFRRAVVGPTRADARVVRSEGAGAGRTLAEAFQSIAHHAARFGGAVIGSHADDIPAPARRRLSLEGRSTFEPALKATTP